MQIIITVAILILLGIVVGSNLLTTLPIVILNQPTIALPIGIWIAIAIGTGLLTSTAIQFLLTLDRRLFKRQIRKQQSRSTQIEDDVFTERTSTTETDNKSTDREVDTPPRRKNLFNSYRAGFNERFGTSRSTPSNPIDDEDEDWDDRPPVNRQQDWDDSIGDRSANRRYSDSRDRIETDRIYSPPQDRYIDPQADGLRREVYDADFRLIQPPYQAPDNEPADRRSATATDRHRGSDDVDDEDWGFDFDNDDAPTRAK
jgi:hypothetical protein